MDAVWGRRLRQAVAAGVECLAYRAAIDLSAIRIEKRLPVQLAAELVDG
ncbi:MAG: hypothetical protein LIP77_08590 [Planctomycetes bacterium]|nr:hypothetical protein [Planctomycetota bacterium]